MVFDLGEINLKTIADPKGFCEECEAGYNKRIGRAVEMITNNLASSPIVLLAGPSGSAKTTRRGGRSACRAWKRAACGRRRIS